MTPDEIVVSVFAEPALVIAGALLAVYVLFVLVRLVSITLDR